jgi:hypothetical protein
VDPRLRPRSANPLPTWQRIVLVASAGSLLVSGLAWLPLHYFLGAGADELPNPVEAWLMRWHGLAVLAGLFALGAVAAAHVPRGWRLGRGRRSGASLCAGWALLAGTGWALSYLVSERWRASLGIAHAALGTIAFAVGVLHARRRRCAPARVGPRTAMSRPRRRPMPGADPRAIG